LIVDGAADASVLSEALDSFQPDGVEAFEVDQVFSLADGVSALGRSQPDCVLLDLGLPDSVGLDGFRRVMAAGPEVPIVLLTALDNEDMALQALALGAQDYLVTEHSSGAVLIQAVRFAIERGRAERSLHDAELQARHAHETFALKLADTQKLEALGVLAGGIAHDFNNLLTVILGNTSLALGTLPADSPARAPLEQVELASRRCADLARQMLAYSGRGRFVVEVVDLAAVLGDLAELIKATISKKAKLSLDFARDTPRIEADVTQLHQVILNLITNASEAIGDDNGTITVSSEQVTADGTYLLEHGAEDLVEGSYALFEVRDTGSGMDTDTMDKLFDPFFTTKFTGRGLGLAAVQGIVRGHRGAIQVQTEPGVGTAFRLWFPAATRQASREPAGATPSTSQLRGTVLVADDDEPVRALAAYLLESFGFDVVTVADGTQALRALVEPANEFAFVLLDLMMPGMSGEEVVDELDRLGAVTPVILSSGFNSDELSHRFVGRGVAAFLQKPYEAAQLRAAADEVIAARSARQPEAPTR
jgi:two-component system cell cycle sensor histidine kinase/response regulator CckA